MASLEDRVAALEAELVRLREKITETHTLAAHADRDVAEFREELRAQTNLLNITRLDMGALREEMGTGLAEVHEEMSTGFAQLHDGMGRIVQLLEGLSDGW